MAQVPDADVLTAAMYQDLPPASGLTDNIDGQPPHHPRKTRRWTQPGDLMPVDVIGLGLRLPAVRRDVTHPLTWPHLAPGG